MIRDFDAKQEFSFDHKTCLKMARNKLKEDGYISAVELSHLPTIGSYARNLKKFAENGDINAVKANMDGTIKWYYENTTKIYNLLSEMAGIVTNIDTSSNANYESGIVVEKYKRSGYDVLYFIDSAKKKVGCKFVVNDVEKIFKSIQNNMPSFPGGHISLLPNNKVFKDEYFDETVCISPDIFNINSGKRIAHMKTYSKFHSDIMNYYHLLINSFDSVINELNASRSNQFYYFGTMKDNAYKK